MSRVVEDSNRRLLRARDAMDRAYAQPLDVAALARVAHVSEAHFIRTFLLETPGPPAMDDATEPIERDYGVDCGLRDPFGNAIRILQPPSPTS
jgi:hypothetical protein